MKNPGEATTEKDSQRAKQGEAMISSARKLEANRRNALKSTGPKTARGKAYSRRNALKHGLFVRHLTDFEALHEDPQEYEELLSGLWDQHQPIGKAEEIEVERIAVCCWRLKRAWRYENAVNLAARRDLVRRELNEQGEYCKERDKEEEAALDQLRSAKKQLEETGEVSQELRERIVATMPGIDGLWSAFDEATKARAAEPGVSKRFRSLSPRERSSVLATYAVKQLIACVEPLSNRRWTNVMEAAIGGHAISDREVVDKLLRYETTTERSLQRALERLERLQRRRMGEVVPPPLNIRLTR